MKTKNATLLFLTAFIWGTAFVAQSVGMDHLGPFAFNGLRNLVGALALLPCILLLDKISPDETMSQPDHRKNLLKGGLCCGLLLFAASSTQQVGMQYTSAGKAGFITAFYIVLVPIFGIFLKHKTSWKVWAAVAIAIVGLYFLCITDTFQIGKGDVYIFISAILYAVHILVIDHFAPKVNGVKMSCFQFFVAGVLSVPCMLALETTTVMAVCMSWAPILYAGVLSSGVGYTLQIIGQKNMNPAIASLILSLESCISVLAGWVVLGEQLSDREMLGCVLMFAAIILAQLPEKKEILCKYTAI